LRVVYLDTSVILNPNFKFSDYEKCYISLISIEELDNLKTNERIGYQARQAIRKIMDADNVEIKLDYSCTKSVHMFLEHKNDNSILSFYMDVRASDKDCILITDDYAMLIKAKALGLPCRMFEFEETKQEVYKGYKEISLNQQEMAEWYQKPYNKWDLLDNQYLILKNDKGNIIDRQRWAKDNNSEYCTFKPISYKQIDNMYTGKIKPKNIQQELTFDLLQNRNINIKCIFGKFGSGKDLLMSSHALSFIQKGIYEKVVFVRNNYGVMNSNSLGFLPGNVDEKLFPFAMPLADHVGGIEGLKILINQGKVELQHLGFIRGRDIKNSIIYCSEAENLTKEHVQLLISRVAEGTTLWLNGDFKQVDNVVFEKNNGLMQMVNSLKGNNLFGCVELDITERSKTARLAELLD